MADVQVEVDSPLQECFLHCEVHCVRDCCGIDAFSTDAGLISEWGQQAGPTAVAEAQRQLAGLVALVEDRSHNVSSSLLNHYTCNEAARAELLEFLAAFVTALAAIAQPDAQPGTAPNLDDASR